MSLRELRRHAGRFAIVGFTGHSVPADLRHLVAEFDLGGVIYFPRNTAALAQLHDLSREVASLSREWPLWITASREGIDTAGADQPFTRWPPVATLGRSGDEGLAARFAAAMVAELQAVGINLHQGPALDIRTNPRNPIDEGRFIGARPDDVARLGAALIRTAQRAGMAACAGHFPGLGDADVDPGEGLPVIDQDRRRFDAVEAVPFRQAIAENVAAIMTAHLLIPGIDERRLTSLSRYVVQSWLKDDLGFGGMVVTDDLGMKAVQARTASVPAAVVEAIAAGTDLVLMSHSSAEDQALAIEALIRAAESGHIPQKRIDDAMKRQHRAKARFLAAKPPIVPLSVVGCDAHQAVAGEMAQWQ